MFCFAMELQTTTHSMSYGKLLTFLFFGVLCPQFLAKVLPAADNASALLPNSPLSTPTQDMNETALTPSSNATRVQVQLVRFENPNSLMFDGRYCDVVSKCDPRIAVDLDVESPYAIWPGPRHPETYQILYEISNQDVFNIAQAVSKDFCPGKKLGNTAILPIPHVQDSSEPTYSLLNSILFVQL
ncbi:uncharacterized protein LOC129583512 isoform X2 [Paramacrobiotus metropolitanus]|uniref:uncharacterized protein LOC129583512 isoform X2 n=1 Tax=Paramacrobiotus metropolitanus TaxID=2943436 RepID=UPI0024458BC9|nr:uncharacterized protein LOC129583512 isoform X2 [Paramacrobiotus metropolitanus]